MGSVEGGIRCLEMVAGIPGLIRGDPIEMEALAGVLATSVRVRGIAVDGIRGGRRRTSWDGVGHGRSVEGNIG